MEYIANKIKNSKDALILLDNYILMSSGYGIDSCLYILNKDMILVINNTRKYYISKEKFVEDFDLLDFYVYKNISEIEIDQEFHKLRQ